jgi:serine/threonine protein kinase
LAHNQKGEFYVIKVYNRPGRMTNEVANLITLNHENVIKLIEYKADGSHTLTPGKITPCSYAVLEWARGGELFDFIITGRFPPEITKMYVE